MSAPYLRQTQLMAMCHLAPQLEMFSHLAQEESVMFLNSTSTAYTEQPMSGHLVPSERDVAASTVVQLRPRIRGGLPPRALRRVREFIETHLEENISIQVLAGIAGLSMYHFARAFKQSEGMTPHEYLIHCRVRRAKDLLAETDLPLSEIALASGFSDQSHCARRFREHVGVTPSSYRWSTR
jgi:transcriptional regulator GlxA family with amidase domain